MGPVVRPPDHDQATVFVAELIRLEREVKQVNQLLDRIETEMRQALSEVARERYEGYV